MDCGMVAAYELYISFNKAAQCDSPPEAVWPGTVAYHLFQVYTLDRSHCLITILIGPGDILSFHIK